MIPDRNSIRIPATSIYWLACTGFIFSLSMFGRSVQKWFMSTISIQVVTPAILLSSTVLLAYLFRKRHHYSIHPVAVVLSGLLLLTATSAVYLHYLRPVEMTHLLLFSVLGWLSVNAFGPIIGCVAMLSIATGDEVLQYFLPDRVGDLHDVLINILSGMLGLWLGKNR